jgi:hypothetical protein
MQVRHYNLHIWPAFYISSWLKHILGKQIYYKSELNKKWKKFKEINEYWINVRKIWYSLNKSKLSASLYAYKSVAFPC